MATPQTGIFALGDAAHIYLEFAVLPGVTPETLVREVIAMHEPGTTVGGVNQVIGFRPEVWRAVAPDDTPAELVSFAGDLPGAEGFVMPATQADVWLWIAGASYDVVFDLGRAAVKHLAASAKLVRELEGWSYRHSRDLTGFEDGTKNPALLIAPSIATVPDGSPGAGGSVLLFQQWIHRTAEWEALPDAAQERVIGRTKPDSLELAPDVMPADSHVSRNTVERDGEERKIFRRNTAFGNVSAHGTLFVGFACDQWRLDRMLRNMAGTDDGMRDALTRYSTPKTGGYYFVPSLQGLGRFAPPPEED